MDQKRKYNKKTKQNHNRSEGEINMWCSAPKDEKEMIRIKLEKQ